MEKIKITILDEVRKVGQEITLSDEMECGKIIEYLINKMDLPLVDSYGAPISYTLIDNATNNPTQKLYHAGIGDGDTLRLRYSLDGNENIIYNSSYCKKCGCELLE